MFQLKPFLRAVLLILFALSLAGCAYTKKTLDLETELDINFEISSDVNPDEDGRASPVVINLLYLKDNRQFEQEDFIALLEDTEGRLGKDLIEKIRLKEFIPSETRRVENPLAEDVKYVVIVAEFIQYQDATGKLVLPIEPHSGNDFDVIVEKDSLSIKD